MEKQPTEWEKLFANHISDVVLMFKIYKELQTQQQKMGKGLEYKFHLRRYTNGLQVHEKMFISY